jgi:rare lipoprotein A
LDNALALFKSKNTDFSHPLMISGKDFVECYAKNDTFLFTLACKRYWQQRNVKSINEFVGHLMLKKIHSVAIYVVYSLLTITATDALAIETGLASYYSDKFQGRQTASGEQYDRNKLTAAHRTLPIGSQIEVTNLKTQNSVIVTVNDRGPYSGRRSLDLSYAAAKEIGLIALGVAPVSYDLVKPKTDSDFEKVIPLEYSPGALRLAQSEEEVIEAEEELANSEKATTEASVKTEPSVSVKTPHKHKAKKLADKAENTANVSHSKNHPTAQAEQKPKSNKSDLKSAEKASKTVQTTNPVKKSTHPQTTKAAK